MDAFRDIPIYLNCRDRVADLENLVGWLENAGYQRIVLVDNDSSWPPMLDYLDRTSHEVLRLGANCGAKSLWVADIVPTRWFVFSDPDVLPIDDCPHDLVAHLLELLQRHPFPKAGPGLYLDDVPRTLRSYQAEVELITRRKEIRQGVFASQIDTTFALYRPGRTPAARRWDKTLQALRLAFPYQCRHMPWYHIDDPTEEERFYLQLHLPEEERTLIKGPAGSSWAQGLQ